MGSWWSSFDWRAAPSAVPSPELLNVVPAGAPVVSQRADENANLLLDQLAQMKGQRCTWIDVTHLSRDDENGLWSAMRNKYELLANYTKDGKRVVHVSLVPLDTSNFCCGMGELIWNGSADY